MKEKTLEKENVWKQEENDNTSNSDCWEWFWPDFNEEKKKISSGSFPLITA